MDRLKRRDMFVLFLLVTVSPLTFAWQGNVTRGPVVEPRDRELERVSLHNLKVARFYIKKKKWAAARDRLQEIVAENPNFSHIAEVYFLLGEVYWKTDEPELAVELYTRVVEEFPQSEFAPRARARLQKLKKSETTRGSHARSKKETRYVHTRGGIGGL